MGPHGCIMLFSLHLYRFEMHVHVTVWSWSHSLLYPHWRLRIATREAKIIKQTSNWLPHLLPAEHRNLQSFNPWRDWIRKNSEAAITHHWCSQILSGAEALCFPFPCSTLFKHIYTHVWMQGEGGDAHDQTIMRRCLLCSYSFDFWVPLQPGKIWQHQAQILSTGHICRMWHVPSNSQWPIWHLPSILLLAFLLLWVSCLAPENHWLWCPWKPGGLAWKTHIPFWYHSRKISSSSRLPCHGRDSNSVFISIEMCVF